MYQYTRMSDKDLAHKVFERDVDAIGELYKRNKDRLYAIALSRLNDEELAADALQDVFLHILKVGRLKVWRPHFKKIQTSWYCYIGSI